MSVLVSIIVPVYNVEKYLKECLDSIVNQTYKEIEILLIDDGSIDSSGCICDEYAQKDRRIRVVHKDNGGLSDARNAGIDLSKGDYLVFIDSDDTVAPDMIFSLVNRIESNANIDVIYFGFVWWFKSRKNYDYPVFASYSGRSALRKWVEDVDIHNYACSAMYKKCLWDDIRFPTSVLYEDIYTTYKVLLKSQVVLSINECPYFYRQRKGSITKNTVAMKLKCLEATEALGLISEIANDSICINSLRDRLLRVKGYILIDILRNKTFDYVTIENAYINEIRRNFIHILISRRFPKSLKITAFLSLFGVRMLEYTFSKGFMNKYYKSKYDYFE